MYISIFLAPNMYIYYIRNKIQHKPENPVNPTDVLIYS